MTWGRRAVAYLAALLLGWLGAAGAAGAAPALWKVSDHDSEIFLFGTLHALSPGLAWRTSAYDDAYARAGTVWFEADLGDVDPARLHDIMQRYGVDPERPLSRKLPPGQLGALAQLVDLRRIDHYRPWVAAMMLEMQPVIGGGASIESGADMAMTRAVRSGAKRLRAFETLEDQARMFASLPESAEVLYLGEVIRERRPRTPLRISGPPNLEKAWVEGDLARLAPALVGEMRDRNPAFYEALLKRRNQAWTDQLVVALQGSGVELVNVGALHLVGEDGLPALLASRGYLVTRVQ